MKTCEALSMRRPPFEDPARSSSRNGSEQRSATAGRLSKEEVQALLADPCAGGSHMKEQSRSVRHPSARARDISAHARAAGAAASRFRAASQRESLVRPMAVPFTKMHGLGNDYIYMEEFKAPIEDPSSLAVAVSDRHFGVGSDGLVLIGPSHRADFRMRIFNADGSEAEMCGNAARCVGKYVFEKGLTTRRCLTLETQAGIRSLHLEMEGPIVARVRVDMGKPRLTPSDLPMLVDGSSFINREIPVGGKMYRATAVSMGNPHLVVPFFGIDSLNLSLIGPQFERHPFFPRGVNTEFVEVRDRSRIRMRVWERGSGETLACGTGACAALVACALNGLTDYRATVELPGGELCVEWDGLGEVIMTGGASFVCSGEYYLG